MGIPGTLVGCEHDGSLDHYARIVRRALNVPVSVVSIVERRRQVFAGASGLSEPHATTRQTPLSHSFCKHVVAEAQPLVVSDARTDPRVAANPAVTELDVVAYAGWPVETEPGRVVGSLCAIDSRPRDWTERDLVMLADLAHVCSVELRQAERHAAATENLTRQIFASVDVAIAFYDLNQRLLLANDLAWRAAELAGWQLDVPPFAGAEVRAADNHTRVPPAEQLLPRALSGDHVDSTMNWLGPPGREVAMISSSRAVLHADGTPWGTLVTSHDVTRLARALQVQEDFVATVSHELRTPLTSIIGYLEVITDALGPQPRLIADALSVIERNACNLKRRIAALVDTGDRQRNLVVRSVDVSALGQGVAATFAERAAAAGISLTVDADQPSWATIDSDRIEQVVENLVSNALKFTRPGGQVRLAVDGTPDTVHIIVSDTGIGMATGELEQAMDLFWRAESTHKAALPGLGIGLTFVRDVVEAHGGAIHIDSHPGQGTSVTVALSRSRNPPTN